MNNHKNVRLVNSLQNLDMEASHGARDNQTQNQDPILRAMATEVLRESRRKREIREGNMIGSAVALGIVLVLLGVMFLMRYV